MSDRELLEKAAKAAGIPWVDGAPSRMGWATWNPLEDDGDEARLEAMLQMHVEWHPANQTVSVGTAEVSCTLPYGKDRQAARRRAGVRAAAALAVDENGRPNDPS